MKTRKKTKQKIGKHHHHLATKFVIQPEETNRRVLTSDDWVLLQECGYPVHVEQYLAA